MEFDGGKIKRKAHEAAKSALYRAGERVANESLRVVPRDTGRLAASQFTNVSTGKELKVTIGYTAEYAKAVHEREGTGARYLELPFDNLKEECLSMIKSGIEEAIK